LHDAAPSLSALLPVAVLGSGAGGATSNAFGFLSRLWDWVATTVGDRATALAIKAQTAADVAGGAKVAAFAATALAAAGGGAAVVETPSSDAGQPKLSQSPSVAVPAQVKNLASQVRRHVEADHKTRAADRPIEFAPQPAARTTPSQVDAEFGPERGGTAPDSSASKSSPKSSSGLNGAEFGP
jgi:hypothetical protein